MINNKKLKFIKKKIEAGKRRRITWGGKNIIREKIKIIIIKEEE